MAKSLKIPKEVFCRSLFVSFVFILAIELPDLHRLMASDYSFGIFKLLAIVFFVLH
jgi:hypothetical protein